MIGFAFPSGQVIRLQPAPARKFRGIRLPGAELFQAAAQDCVISVHEYTQRLFRYSLVSLHSLRSRSIIMTEKSNYLRFETVVTGEFIAEGEERETIRILPGQYQITNVKSLQVNLEAGQSCIFFMAYMSPELLGQTPLADSIRPGGVWMMTKAMRELIQKITDNPFEHRLRDAFYDYCTRELLFYIVSAPALSLPGQMMAAEVAAVYEADRIIAENLNRHYSIGELARLTRTNAHVLKTGFAHIYGMGMFERLLQRKMEKARYLLEMTDKQIQEISMLAGYETVTGFINAFRREFGMSPKVWRKKSRDLGGK